MTRSTKMFGLVFAGAALTLLPSFAAAQTIFVPAPQPVLLPSISYRAPVTIVPSIPYTRSGLHLFRSRSR
jgi:hypothetical protein